MVAIKVIAIEITRCVTNSFSLPVDDSHRRMKNNNHNNQRVNRKPANHHQYLVTMATEPVKDLLLSCFFLNSFYFTWSLQPIVESSK